MSQPPSLRIRRLHAAEDPAVRAELAAALAARWTARAEDAGSGGALEPAYHAAIIAGMYAAQATEAEVAAYLAAVEQSARPDAAFAATLLRIALRLDDPAVRGPVT